MTSKGSIPRVLRLRLLLAAVASTALATLPPSACAAGVTSVEVRTAAPFSASSEARTHGAHVHLKGFARIEAHVALAMGKLVVSGTVTDDAGRADSGTAVSVGLGRAPLGGGAVSIASASPEACRDTNKPPALDGPERLLLYADVSGRFCVRLSLPKERYVAHIEVPSSESLDGARLEMPLDPSLKPATLRFDLERPVLSLDDDTTNLDVVASTEENGVTSTATGLWLAVTNELGVTLGFATTNASGRARFAIPSARLGPPGKGELRTTFAGNADVGASTYSVYVERSTKVDLSVPDANDGRRSIGSPEDGITIPVIASSRCSPRGCGGSPTGVVEARVGEITVGAATLELGGARLVVGFAMTGAAEVPLRLRYVPDAPWFRPTGELVVTQPVRGQSPWRRWPLALAGLGAVVWFVMVRLPRQAPTRADRPTLLPRPRGGARVELVRGDPTSSGWTGHVVDADEHIPVANARVSIERRGFERVEVIAKATSDAQGAFTLEPIDSLPGDELAADATLHARVRRPLPANGELRVALVLRRRALLDRLVDWAHRRGKPFDGQPDPTPGQIRRAAGPAIDLVRWASAVERAAYGGGVVDEQAERAVDRLAPSEVPDPSGVVEDSPSTPERPRR